jgi:hypothetical protein
MNYIKREFMYDDDDYDDYNNDLAYVEELLEEYLDSCLGQGKTDMHENAVWFVTENKENKWLTVGYVEAILNKLVEELPRE